MVKQQYREIVAVETGAVPGKDSGYYYYDSRPNAPKKLLFQPTSAQKAYDTSTKKGIPTAGAFFGTGTGAPFGGGGRYQPVDYTQQKTTQTQPVAFSPSAQIMQQLTPEQRAGVKLGLSTLTQSTPNDWILTETQKGFQQRRKEALLAWQLGEGFKWGGSGPPRMSADRIRSEAAKMFNILQPESDFFRREAPSGYQLQAFANALDRAEKSYQLQSEVYDIPAFLPPPPMTPIFTRGSSIKPFGPYTAPLPNWDQTRQNLQDMSMIYQQTKAGIPPVWQVAADTFFPGTGTTLDQIQRTQLAPSYISPGQSADSLFGPVGFGYALGERMQFLPPRGDLGPYAGALLDMQLRDERKRFEMAKAGLNLLDIPSGLDFLIGVGQVPGDIYRGGLTKEEYQAARTADAWGDSGYYMTPNVDRIGAAAAIGAGVVDWGAGIIPGIKESYRKDPDLFEAQLAGELIAYPFIAGTLAKGGAVSRTLGKGFEFVTEPGEAALEAALNLKYPGFAARMGGSLGVEELALQAMLQGGRYGARGAQRLGRGLDDYILRTYTPIVESPGGFIELTRPGELISIPTEITIPGYGPRIIETPIGTGMTSRVDFSPLMRNPRTGEIYEVDELTPRQIERSDKALAAIARRKERLERIKELKEQREEYLDAYGKTADFSELLEELEKEVSEIRGVSPSMDATLDATLQEARKLDRLGWEQVFEMGEVAFPNLRTELRAIRSQEGAPYRNPIYVPEDALWYDWRRAANYLPEAIPIALGMDFVFPDLRRTMRGLQGAETAYYRQRQQIDPVMQAYQEQLLEEFGPVIDSRVFRGEKADLDYMPPEAILSPQQLLTLRQMQQVQQLQNPMGYGTDPALRFNFPPTDGAGVMLRPDLDYMAPDAIPFPPIQTPGLDVITAQAQGAAVGVRQDIAQRLDVRQKVPEKLKLKQNSRLRMRLRADIKRREIEQKRFAAKRKRAERTRRRFLLDLFKDEVNIPEVNIPEVNIPEVNIPRVNIPEVNIPRVNIPEVNIPRVNIPRVNVPEVNIPRVNIPEVNIPEVDYKVNVPKVNVPKVNVPKVELYK